MSAIVDGPDGVTDGPVPLINVLFTMHPNFDTLDLCGPLEVLGHARHVNGDPSEFKPSIAPPLYDLGSESNTRHQLSLESTSSLVIGRFDILSKLTKPVVTAYLIVTTAIMGFC